jgi:TonB family protein
MELAPLTVLNQRYTVKRTLGDPGPFDITYLGQDVDSGDDEFIIREFFPVHLATREEEKTSVEMTGEEEADLFDSGLEYFSKESQVLAELDHPALPASYDTFEANGTYYRVRPHPPSMSLAKGLENKGQVSEKAALTIMMPILEALHTAHDTGLYHGGVSPRTIRLLEGGDVLLTGFRGAFLQLARETGKMSELVQPGTSAVEQYTPRGQQGPWTDVYAAAATICQMVTGKELPEATDRLEGEDTLEELVQDADAFSGPGVREALVDALAVDPSQRLQSIEALKNALTESSTGYDEAEEEASYSIMDVETEARDEPDEPGDDEVEVLSASADRSARPSGRSSRQQQSSSSNTALLIGIPILLVALGGGAWFMMSSSSSSSKSAGGPSSAYKNMRAQADSLFKTKKYEQAEFFYNQALQLEGDHKYIRKRLARLQEIQAQSSDKQYKQQLARGDSIKDVADSLFDRGNLNQASSEYSKALGAFYSAQSINPEGGQAQQRISSIQQRQEQIARQQAQKVAEAQSQSQQESENVSINQLAEFFKKRGDRQLQAGNTQAAIDKYKQALEYRPDDGQLKQKVDELQNRLKEQQGRQKFQESYNKGRRLLRAGKFQEAQKAFQKAKQVMPNEPRLQQAMEMTEKMIRQEKQRTQKYERYRATGDSLFKAGAYEQAIANFRNALKIRQDDNYIKKRIEEANREIEQLRLAKEQMKKQGGKQVVDDAGVYERVDQKPKVKGGMATLTRSATYPEGAGQTGRVYVQAIVEADGSVRGAKVVRGLEKPINEEALRVVKNAEFTPGRYDGKAVPARKTVWVQFRP